MLKNLQTFKTDRIHVVASAANNRACVLQNRPERCLKPWFQLCLVFQKKTAVADPILIGVTTPILESQIPGSWPFSPIQNSRIGNVLIPEFLYYKKIVKN